MRPTLKYYCWMLLILLLTACNLRELYVPRTPAPTVTLTVPQPTVLASPNIPPTLIPTPRPRRTLAPTPTNTALPSVKVPGLRVAYILDGNLYVQDSGGPPHQITSSGKDHHPKFSSDGEKIIFYRGRWDEHNDVYVIDQDGTQERALITTDLLMSLNYQYGTSTEPGSLSWIPETQELFFDTQEFIASDDFSDDLHQQYSIKNYDLLTVDINTFEIKKVFSKGKIYRFPIISPNGKLMTDGVNLFRPNGAIARTSLTTLWPKDVSRVQGPSLLWAFWSQDSNKITILPPIDKKAALKVGAILRTTWQHFLNGRKPVETRFYPALMGVESVSPNGNLIVYSYLGDARWKRGMYLGNVITGTMTFLRETVTSIDIFPKAYYWNPDNIHFIFEDQKGQLYLGDIYGKTVIYPGSGFLGWLDEKRYIYGQVTMRQMGQAGISAVQLAGAIQEPGPGNLTYIYIKPE